MTQRSSPILTSQLSRSLQKSQDPKSKITLLKKILLEAGVELSSGDDPHTLKQEQSLVVRDLEKIFGNTPNCMNEFVEGLKLMCKKEKYFKKALMITHFNKNDNNLSLVNRQQKLEQESIFRIFLKVSHLQKRVIEILLDEITSVASEATEDTSWLRLLLNSLRYLSYYENAEQLCVKLLEILEIATQPAQLEILDLIPEIVSDSQYEEVAKQLCQLMDEKDELTAAVIDCLNALNLDQEIRSQVQDTILSKILSGCNLKDFPILLSFLITDCKSQNLVPTLLKIRNALDTIMLSSSDRKKEKESCKILIFAKLQAFAISPRTVSEAWLNMMSSIKSSADHKPIDYLILFMLHSTAHYKRRVIEAIFRKRVHCGLLKISSLEKMFEKYIPQQLMKDYFNSIVEIGCSLMRSSNDPVVIDFASVLLRTLFSHDYTETIYQREMLDSVIILTGSSDKKTVSNILKLLSSLLNFKTKLQTHTIMLLRLLEKLDSFELKDVKEVFEILCTLTCGENTESFSGLRDEIHMVVRKQLYSTKRNIKQRGIIAAVVMARHLVLMSEEQDVSIRGSFRTSNCLPYGPARDAANLLELAITCTSGSADLMGLYYDQVAAMLIPNTHFDKHFMVWLNETVTEHFQEKYVTQVLPEKVNDLSITMQHLLNRDDEMEDPLGINIAGLTLNNDSSVLLLAPHFRLLRLLHYRMNNKDLSGIDSLLGCAVLMPDIDDIDDLDSDQVRQVADCQFHCVNWFREIISGFVTQNDKQLRNKVVRRLENVIEMEKNIQSCMEKCPDHKLPLSYFDCVSELYRPQSSPRKECKTSNPKKKAKSAATVQDCDETANTTAVPSQVKRKVSTKSSPVEHQINFREMDTDLFLLLKYPLKLPGDNFTQTATQNATLTLDQLTFILKDFASKLAILTKGKNIGLSHLNMVVPSHIISDGVVLLPNLNSHLKIIIKSINKLLETTDGRLDLPEMFTEKSLKLKNCFGLIIEIFHLIFSWAGFQHSSNLEIFKNLLRSMRTVNSQTPHSANRLTVDFINDLLIFTDQCLELSHAVNLVKTMEALYSAITPSPDINKKIVMASSKLLSKRWYNSKGSLENGKNHKANVEALIKVYLSNASVKTICDLVGTLQDQVKSLTTKEDYLHMLASIDKQCLHLFYYGLCNALLNRVKVEVQSSTNSQHLALWNSTALIMQGLMCIAKTNETKGILACFLKKSIGILKVFLSHGIPIMEMTLKSKTDEVVAIFKAMQTSTRFLHHLCCHSKVTKDTSLMAFVPAFKLTLETLVYRVKAVLAANNCSEAFWMGNLRNRDLHGEDILSQSTVISEENVAGASDEELPNDDDDDTSDLDDVECNTVNGSVSSEVFD